MVDRIDRLEKLVSGLSGDVGNLRASIPSSTRLVVPTLSVNDDQGRSAVPPSEKKKKEKPNKASNVKTPSSDAGTAPMPAVLRVGRS